MVTLISQDLSEFAACARLFWECRGRYSPIMGTLCLGRDSAAAAYQSKCDAFDNGARARR